MDSEIISILATVEIVKVGVISLTALGMTALVMKAYRRTKGKGCGCEFCETTDAHKTDADKPEAK